MTYLLDTDIMIFLIRGLKPSRRAPEREQAESLVSRCVKARTAGDAVGLSAVTISELEFGARNSQNYENEIEAVHKILTPFDIHDYDSVSCPAWYGKVRHELNTKGVSIGAMDLLIAAHALALNATLVTNNTQHFTRVQGLKTVNWLHKPS